jgi:hypothetical protein
MVAEQELDVLESLEAHGEITGLLHRPLAGGCSVTPPRCIRRVPYSMNTSTYSLLSRTVSACRKSTARIPPAWLPGIAARSAPCGVILLRQPNDEAADARDCWRAAGLAPPGRVVLFRGQFAVPG